MYVVYGLVDPRDNLPFYVGITDDLYTRFLQHLKCGGDNYRKDDRILELRSLNKMVIMVTLQEVETKEKAHDREAYWIHHYLQLGVHLCNATLPTPRQMKIKIPLQQQVEETAMKLFLKQTSVEEAIRQLDGMGWSKREIVEKLFNCTKGGSKAWQDGAALYDAVMASKKTA